MWGWTNQDKPKGTALPTGVTDTSSLLCSPDVAVARVWWPYCLRRGCCQSHAALGGSSLYLPRSVHCHCTLRPAAQGIAPEYNVPQAAGYEIPSFPRLVKEQWLPPDTLSAWGDKGSFLTLEHLLSSLT